MSHKVTIYAIVLLYYLNPAEPLLEGNVNDDEVILVSGNDGAVLTYTAIIGTMILSMAISLLGVYLLIVAVEDDGDEFNYRQHHTHQTPYRSIGDDKNESIVLSRSRDSRDPISCLQKLICELVSSENNSENRLVESLFKKHNFPILKKYNLVNAISLGKMLESAKLCAIRYQCDRSKFEIQQDFQHLNHALN